MCAPESGQDTSLSDKLFILINVGELLTSLACFTFIHDISYCYTFLSVVFKTDIITFVYGNYTHMFKCVCPHMIICVYGNNNCECLSVFLCVYVIIIHIHHCMYLQKLFFSKAANS